MHIIIVGAGLGGLSASLAFSRQGHKTTLLEARPALSQAGGGLNVRPGASRIMKTWGLKPDLERIGDHTSSFVIRNVQTGEMEMRSVATELSDEVDYGTTREALMEVLYLRASEAGAEVVFDAGVERVEEDEHHARVVLKDGEKREADLVLAADGIRSRIRYQILADATTPIDPVVSDVTLYGFQVDAAEAMARSDTKRICVEKYATVWKGQDGFVVSRLNRTLGICSCLFGVKLENDMKGLWDEKGDIDFVRDIYKDSCEDLRAVLAMAQDCDRWKLAEMPDLPRWTSKGGRVALLGDSAHAMEPNAAQGFSMIVEDIGVLEYLISRAPAAATLIPTITAMWQRLRKPRVERIKAYAKQNTAAFVNASPSARLKSGDPSRQREVKSRSMRNVKPDMTAEFHSSAFLKWTLDYDAVGEAKKTLDATRAHL